MHTTVFTYILALGLVVSSYTLLDDCHDFDTWNRRHWRLQLFPKLMTIFSGFEFQSIEHTRKNIHLSSNFNQKKHNSTFSLATSKKYETIGIALFH